MSLIVLTLELDAARDPITGRITDASGVIVAFCGWLDLADALSRLVGSDAPTAPAAP